MWQQLLAILNFQWLLTYCLKYYVITIYIIQLVNSFIYLFFNLLFEKSRETYTYKVDKYFVFVYYF